MAKEYEYRIIVTDPENTGAGAIEECFMQMFDSFDAAPYEWQIEAVREAYPRRLRHLRDRSVCPKCEKPTMKLDEKGEGYMGYYCPGCEATVYMEFDRKGMKSALLSWLEDPRDDETFGDEKEEILYKRD